MNHVFSLNHYQPISMLLMAVVLLLLVYRFIIYPPNGKRQSVQNPCREA
jgi:quinol-cytochrome oxidoreductase complex cytochrome b subunit